MLKMYHGHVAAGDSAAFWEEFGSEGTLADRVRFCELDPLRPLFDRYLAPGAVMLEGGCGRGQYVAYYTARGAKVIGLDFARDWLRAIRADAPSLPLCAGDVSALPFSAGVFDLYYSGGVVEHFEAGAHTALAEARRVLKPGGILLLSVPYDSPFRKVLAWFKKDWRRVPGPRVDNGDMGERNFFQYAYTVAEFDAMLAAAGLRVLDHQGYAILWGLYDVEPIHRFVTRLSQRRAGSRVPLADPAPERSAGPAVPRDAAAPVSRVKRLLVSEDVTVPGAGWSVRLGRWAFSNMMMYVCTPDDGRARK